MNGRQRFADFTPDEFQLLDTTQIWQGPIFRLIEDEVKLRTGEASVKRQYIDHGGAVAIVPARFNAELQAIEVLLIAQYRHPVRKVLWEIPAGLLDRKGESKIDAAKRELREEADLRAATWRCLTEFYTSPGASSEMVTIYLATDLTECEEQYPRTEEEALMETAWVPLWQAVDAVLSGEIHSPTAAMGVLATNALRQREEWPNCTGKTMPDGV